MQVHLPKLAHFELDSAYQGLVAVDGLPALLSNSAERLPSLASLALNGLSLVPLSGSAPPGQLRRSLSGRNSPPRQGFPALLWQHMRCCWCPKYCCAAQLLESAGYKLSLV